MVWIHGGAFEMGGTVDPLYEAHNFVEENPDVIVTSIEYRVGVFGFSICSTCRMVRITRTRRIWVSWIR